MTFQFSGFGPANWRNKSSSSDVHNRLPFPEDAPLLRIPGDDGRTVESVKRVWIEGKVRVNDGIPPPMTTDGDGSIGIDGSGGVGDESEQIRFLTDTREAAPAPAFEEVERG